MSVRPHHSARRKATSILGLTVLIAATLQVLASPAAFAAPPIFADEFTNLNNWTPTRITLDTSIGSPTLPSARAQVTAQSAFAFVTLGTTTMTPCMSMNVNLSAGSGVDLFRLRTAANGPIIKAFVAANGTLQMRSTSARPPAPPPRLWVPAGTTSSCAAPSGSPPTWNLYRDGVQIVNTWAGQHRHHARRPDPDR